MAERSNPEGSESLLYSVGIRPKARDFLGKSACLFNQFFWRLSAKNNLLNEATKSDAKLSMYDKYDLIGMRVKQQRHVESVFRLRVTRSPAARNRSFRA